MNKRQENEWAAKSEAILMGMMQKVYSPEEAEFILDYICKVVNAENLTGKQIAQQALQYCKGGKIEYIHIGRVAGMVMISMPISTKGEPIKDITSPKGVFGYVYNLSEPMFSELGYSCYAKKGGKLTRVS